MAERLKGHAKARSPIVATDPQILASVPRRILIRISILERDKRIPTSSCGRLTGIPSEKPSPEHG